MTWSGMCPHWEVTLICSLGSDGQGDWEASSVRAWELRTPSSVSQCSWWPRALPSDRDAAFECTHHSHPTTWSAGVTTGRMGGLGRAKRAHKVTERTWYVRMGMHGWMRSVRPPTAWVQRPEVARVGWMSGSLVQRSEVARVGWMSDFFSDACHRQKLRSETLDGICRRATDLEPE